MKWPSAICFFLAAMGAASEEATTPPSFEGLNPSQIEKIMIEEILSKPKKGSGKEGFNFVKTVKPILATFKKQLLSDKRKMQSQLDADIKAIKKCISKMKKSTKVALMETEADKKKKKKKHCPTKKQVDNCAKKMERLKPKQKACKDLEKVGKKDDKTGTELVKQWNKKKILKKDCKIDKGETRYHYVTRLANHFTKKLKAFEKKLKDVLKQKKHGKKLKKGCDVIKHYQRKLKQQTCEDLKARVYACSCGKVVKEQKICKMFSGCYSASVRAAKNNEKEIRKKNAAAKLEWRAVGRIECLLKVMGGKKGANANQLNKCVKGPQVSTKPLDLKYYAIPKKPKCAMKGVSANVRKLCLNKKKKR